jgi:hypothetical protein
MPTCDWDPVLIFSIAFQDLNTSTIRSSWRCQHLLRAIPTFSILNLLSLPGPLHCFSSNPYYPSLLVPRILNFFLSLFKLHRTIRPYCRFLQQPTMLLNIIINFLIIYQLLVSYFVIKIMPSLVWVSTRVDTKWCFQFFANYDYRFLLDVIIAIIAIFFAKAIIAISRWSPSISLEW